MSKSKADGDQIETAEAIAVPGLKPAPLGFPATSDVVTPIGSPRVFRDTVYTSRTMVFPDGSTAPVLEGRVTALGDEQFDFLSAHPDLMPLPE